MFRTVCPTLYEKRWHYMHEVLDWVALRYECLKILDPDSIQADNHTGITEVDSAALKRIFLGITLTFELSS